MREPSAETLRRVKVLHLIPSLVGGGAERQLALLALELSRAGVEVHLGFIHGGANLDLLHGTAVGLHHISSRGNHDPMILVRIIRLIRALRPDVIQTWFRQMDVLGGVGAMFEAIPFVLSERSSALAYPDTWKNRLRLQVGRRALAVVANSLAGAAYWAPVTAGKRTVVIRNGIPQDFIDGALPADPGVLGHPAHVRLIVFAGRLSEEKNISTIVRAFDEVLQATPDCIALLLGEGPLEAKVRSWIAATTSRDRMQLLGYRRDIWCWMRRAAAFVSMSRFEGTPNAVLEAMAIGCPLVVSDIPQHREILDQSTAILCEPDSTHQVAASILNVLLDPQAAAERAAAARRRATAWSIDAMTHQYVEFYQELAHPHPREA